MFRLAGIVVVVLACCCSELVAQVEPENKSVEIDGLKIPLGKSIEISGPCSTTGSFDLIYTYSSASLRGLRIEGQANQQAIEFYLVSPKNDEGAVRKKLKSLTKGNYYEVRGTATDARTFGPNKAVSLLVEQIEAVPTAPLGFADFVDRQATFEGTTVTGGRLQVGGETVQVGKLTAWSSAVAGKTIAVQGTIRRLDSGWQIEKPTWRLVNLADQVGEDVLLEGTLRSTNGHWWFNYRGEDIYLTETAGPTLTFPGADHRRRVHVRGKLARQLRPSLDQISLKSDRDLVPCFVVRGAKAEYLEDAMPFMQRFGAIYPTTHTIKDGVPELLAEVSYRRNLMGNETTAQRYLERNREAITSILASASERTRDVVAKRMDDESLEKPLRLLYATVLAAANDPRGRTFLIEEAKRRDPETFVDTLFCLGNFSWFFVDGNEKSIQIAWAETILIDLMSDRNEMTFKVMYGDTRSLPVADAVSIYSDIPSVLGTINSARSRNAIVDYILWNHEPASDVLYNLCSARLLPIKDLLRMEEGLSDRNSRRTLMIQLLRHNHPEVGRLFAKDLADSTTYREFRDRASTETVETLRPLIPDLTGKAQRNARILVLLKHRDPVPELLALLDDTDWKDKNLVLWELVRLNDRRAVVPVAQKLSNAPADYFNADAELEATFAVRHALDVVAQRESPDSVSALIALLSVDLSRFGSYIDREGFQRIVAAHLIELTGESFGVDAEAWRQWHAKSNPER